MGEVLVGGLLTDIFFVSGKRDSKSLEPYVWAHVVPGRITPDVPALRPPACARPHCA